MDPRTDTELMQKIHDLCYPRSVAVIGASDNVLKWGSFLLINLLSGKFAGPAYPINPKARKVLGRECYPNLAACPGPVDLVFITLPQPKVLEAIAECAAKGVKNVVVITSGYSETGAEGARFEQELVAAVRAAGMRLLGPNTMGMMSTHQKLYCTGSNSVPPKGAISMISQSGNLGAQVMTWAEEQNVGINKFFGTGNEADLNCTDLLNYLAYDESTRAILLYVEGVEDGQAFLRAARAASERKPVVLLKSGRTDIGAKAAASHTGAMSGSFAVFEGAMRQAGAIVVRQPMDLIDGAAGSYLPMPKGRRVAIVTLGGGWGVVGSDLCRENGLKLPPVPESVIAELDKMLPSFWSRQNPLDLVGQINPEIYCRALEEVVKNDAFDSVLTLGLVGSSSFVAGTMRSANEVAPETVTPEMVQQVALMTGEIEKNVREEIVRLIKTYGKPIVNVALNRNPQILLPVGDDFVVSYSTPEKAVRILAGMTAHQYWRAANGLS